jgi:Family of unknown function (DUF695)
MAGFEWLRRLFRKTTPLEEELKDWRIVSAVNQPAGQAAVFRVRLHKPAVPEIAAFKTAIRVTWEPEAEAQFANEETRRRQLAFEEALDDLSGYNGFAELVQVSTGLGTKEWLYYTSSIPQFGDTFHRLLEGHERYPVTLQFHEDPDWKIWSDFVKTIMERAEERR